jgi:ribosomal protein L14
MIAGAIGRMRQTDPAGYLMQAVRRFGFERMFGRYYGIYRAIVIDNSDPELRGRCRVQVPSLGHTSEKDVPADLYAIPCMTGLSVGESGQIHGSFFPPDVGDQVWVTFEKGLPCNPVYMGGWVHAGNVKGDEVRTESATTKAIRTKSGHYITFDDDGGSIRISRGDGDGNPSGTLIVLDGDTVLVTSSTGSSVAVTGDTVTMVAKDGSLVTCGDGQTAMVNANGTSLSLDGADVSIAAAGDINLTSGGKITIKAGTVDIGKGPVYEPAVMGNTFAVQYLTHTHVTTVPTLPTSPQVGAPPVPLSGLSLGVRVSS